MPHRPYLPPSARQSTHPARGVEVAEGEGEEGEGLWVMGGEEGRVEWMFGTGR